MEELLILLLVLFLAGGGLLLVFQILIPVAVILLAVVVFLVVVNVFFESFGESAGLILDTPVFSKRRKTTEEIKVEERRDTRNIFIGLFIVSVISIVYSVSSYHLVTFQKKWHLVEKEHPTFENTLVHLDKKPQLWVLVAMSPNLRKYMLLHYPRASAKKLLQHKKPNILQKAAKIGKKSWKKFKSKVRSFWRRRPPPRREANP